MKKYVDGFAAMIKNEHSRRVITQASMVELLDTTVKHYQYIETGREKPGCETLYRLVHRVGVRPEVIFGLSYDKDNSEYLDA